MIGSTMAFMTPKKMKVCQPISESVTEFKNVVMPHPNLGISTGNDQQSPLVIAFQRAGINVLPSIINALVCTSALSCGSSCVFLASRNLYGLAEDEQAPQFLFRNNRFGAPYLAVAASFISTPLVYLSLGATLRWCLDGSSILQPLPGSLGGLSSK